MDEDAVDQVAGQFAALSLVLTAVSSALSPQVAQAAAVALRASLDVERERERAQGDTSASTARTRDELVGAFLELLATRGRG